MTIKFIWNYVLMWKFIWNCIFSWKLISNSLLTSTFKNSFLIKIFSITFFKRNFDINCSNLIWINFIILTFEDFSYFDFEWSNIISYNFVTWLLSTCLSWRPKSSFFLHDWLNSGIYWFFLCQKNWMAKQSGPWNKDKDLSITFRRLRYNVPTLVRSFGFTKKNSAPVPILKSNSSFGNPNLKTWFRSQTMEPK